MLAAKEASLYLQLPSLYSTRVWFAHIWQLTGKLDKVITVDGTEPSEHVGIE